jgi:hypothetical protein
MNRILLQYFLLISLLGIFVICSTDDDEKSGKKDNNDTVEDVDVTGQWQPENAANGVSVFNDDGTYENITYSFTGTYTVSGDELTLLGGVGCGSVEGVYKVTFLDDTTMQWTKVSDDCVARANDLDGSKWTKI